MDHLRGLTGNREVRVWEVLPDGDQGRLIVSRLPAARTDAHSHRCAVTDPMYVFVNAVILGTAVRKPGPFAGEVRVTDLKTQRPSDFLWLLAGDRTRRMCRDA